jgi:hypothetical protein
MSGRQYTWAGSGDNLTFEKLDSLSQYREGIKIPSYNSTCKKDRSNTDHTPLLLHTGASSHNRKPPMFKIERGWLIRDGFYDLIADKWQSETKGTNVMEIW